MANGNFGGGNGTLSLPYLVEDGADFLKIFENSTSLQRHYKQVADIDLTGISITNNNYFTGSYDGDNNSITGINHSTSDSGSAFPRISGATIKNLKLFVDSHRVGVSVVSGFVGDCYNSTVYNVHVKGNIHGDSNVGGIAGYSYNSSYKYCSFIGNASANSSTSNLGGIIGRTDGSDTIDSCWFEGSLEGNILVGGIAGQLSSNSKILNCYSKGTLKSNSYFLGGISGASCSLIQNCYSSCNLINTSTSSNTQTGGIVGGLNSGDRISNCFYLGEYIQRASGSNSNLFGDIYGNISVSNPRVYNCYSLDTLEFREG